MQGDCHREAPSQLPFPDTSSDSPSVLPRRTGQCILVVSGSFMHVAANSAGRMWMHGLYIHMDTSTSNVETILDELTDGSTFPSAAPGESAHEHVLCSNNLNNTDASNTAEHCERVPKLLEISGGKVWASDVTMQGNGGLVMGVSVGLGGSLYMQGAHIFSVLVHILPCVGHRTFCNEKLKIQICLEAFSTRTMLYGFIFLVDTQPALIVLFPYQFPASVSGSIVLEDHQVFDVCNSTNYKRCSGYRLSTGESRRHSRCGTHA